MSDKDNINGNYEKHYSEESFWDKIKKYAKKAGRQVVELSFQLYYAYQSPETPAKEKAIILGALGYFIFPIDAIPDITPLIGYTDDLGVLLMAIYMVAKYITPEIKSKAKIEADKLFGKDEDYEKHYSKEGFWDKIKAKKKAGRRVVELAFQLYYALQSPETPKWEKTMILSALGYFISPIDVIPDSIPIVGYMDDLGVLAIAVSVVARYITDEMRSKAKNETDKLFGEEKEDKED